MLTKLRAIDRLLRETPYLQNRRYGLPYIGKRHDGEQFNPTVQAIADAINFYGYEVRDENIVSDPDTDLGTGNPILFRPFGPAILEMKKSIENDYMSNYPYTEGDDNIRKSLLEYVEKEGFINTEPYVYEDVDEKGLSVNNITFMPSTSVIFNQIINIISKPGDVVLVTGPSYGLFTVRAERAGAEVEVLNLEKEDKFYINPIKLANKIDEINESLQKVYNRRKGYVPRVVAFVNANPNNPTGKVMGKNEIHLLENIAEVCKQRGVFVIDDLVYRDISYDKNNIAMPIATIPGMFRNTISLFGLSKSYSMASLRAGFVVADEIIIRELVNRIFQEMDSSPDILGKALKGAFNASKERYIEYDKYFDELREMYIYRFNLLKAMISGIDKIPLNLQEKVKTDVFEALGKEDGNKILNGVPFIDFYQDLEPQSGFFAIIDFTKLKGMKYKGLVIRNEKDLLKFFYLVSRVRFLIGQSISWPYKDELIGRITYSIDKKKLIIAVKKINDAISLLDPKDDYIIRKNEYKDQEQMAALKLNTKKSVYDKIVSSRYLNVLSEDELAERYKSSFEDYKDSAIVAVRKEEVLGYVCFNTFCNVSDKFDSEIICLCVKDIKEKKQIQDDLVFEVYKELLSLGKKNTITWCFANDKERIDFFTNIGGKIIDDKEIKLNNEKQNILCFYFSLTI